jgi:uncharacterized protein YnzC (UPF0291/DUF896 family)
MNIHRKGVAVALALGAMTLGGGLSAQKAAPADLAAKLSGTWVVNRELSPGFSAPGGRRGGGGPSFALAGIAGQRRGSVPGGGDGSNGASDLTPEELAAQAAIRQLQQVAQTITIKATPESVTFTDPRGEQTFAINDKNTTIDLAGSKITAKNKWEKATLRQEFSNPKTKLVRTWEVDENNRLVLKAKLESMTLVSTEVKAVFDRQQQ